MSSILADCVLFVSPASKLGARTARKEVEEELASHGAQIARFFNKNVTHLISTEGDRDQSAAAKQARSLSVPIVPPSFFTDAIKNSKFDTTPTPKGNASVERKSSASRSKSGSKSPGKLEAKEKPAPAKRGSKSKALGRRASDEFEQLPAKKQRTGEKPVQTTSFPKPLEIPGFPSLLQVPSEPLLQHIFAKLDLQSLRNVALACKTLSDLIWHDEVFWKEYIRKHACAFFFEEAPEENETPLEHAKKRLVSRKLSMLAKFHAVCSVVKVTKPLGDNENENARLERRLKQLSELNWLSFEYALYDTVNDPPVTDKEDKYGFFRESYCWEVRTTAVKAHEESLLAEWRAKYPINTVALHLYIYPDRMEFGSGTLLHNSSITKLGEVYLEAEDRYLRMADRWADPDDSSLDSWDKDMAQNSFLVQPFRWPTVAECYEDLLRKEQIADKPTTWNPLPADIRQRMTVAALEQSPNVALLRPHEQYGDDNMFKAPGDLVGTAYFTFESGYGLKKLRWQFVTTSYETEENLKIFIAKAAVIEKMVIFAKGKPKREVGEAHMKLDAKVLTKHFNALHKEWNAMGSLKHFPSEESVRLTFRDGAEFLIYAAPAVNAIKATIAIQFF